MRRPPLDDLNAFAAVARAGSFTRAAAALGVSQPALSHAIRAMEERLGVRLLHRTTRSVSPTQAGTVLLQDVGPALDLIEEALARVRTAGAELAGNLRIAADRYGYDAILRPVLPSFLATHPRVVVEVSLDDAFIDIVGSGFDAGLRLGDFVQKDMVAVRVGPDVEIAVVGSPDYLARTGGAPLSPRALTSHACLNFRMPRTGGLFPWAFEKDGRQLSIRVEGSLVLDDGPAILGAALDGVGLGYLFLDQVAHHLSTGRLTRVLADWSPRLPGFRLYYPSRRQQHPPLAALTAHLRGAIGPEAG